jgi:hypothetical protein
LLCRRGGQGGDVAGPSRLTDCSEQLRTTLFRGKELAACRASQGDDGFFCPKYAAELQSIWMLSRLSAIINTVAVGYCKGRLSVQFWLPKAVRE